MKSSHLRVRVWFFMSFQRCQKSLEKDGIPYNVIKHDWITKISKEIYNDMSKWIKIWRNNDVFERNPHLIKVGDLLYWYPKWYKAKDPTERNKLPKRKMSSSEVENYLLWKHKKIVLPL